MHKPDLGIRIDTPRLCWNCAETSFAGGAWVASIPRVCSRLAGVCGAIGISSGFRCSRRVLRHKRRRGQTDPAGLAESRKFQPCTWAIGRSRAVCYENSRPIVPSLVGCARLHRRTPCVGRLSPDGHHPTRTKSSAAADANSNKWKCRKHQRNSRTCSISQSQIFS
jgi:hypothetical protein